MQRFRQREIKKILEFLPELYKPRDEKAFERYLVAAVPKIISSNIAQFHRGNALNFPLPEPVTYPDVYPIANIMEILGTYAYEHPIIAHVLETGCYGPCRISELTTRERFHSTHLYNELYRYYGIEEMMGVSLNEDAPGSDCLALMRDQCFSDPEKQMLGLLRPHLNRALQNARALSNVESELTQLNGAVASLARGLITLNEDGRVTLMTPLAFGWLTEYFERPPRPDALPDPVKRWFRTEKRKLIAKGESIPTPLSPLVAEREDKKLTVRLISDVNGDSLVLEETASRLSPHSILGQFSLTEREAEVLYWVAEGKTNGEIGTILSTSARTVAKHLEHIYQKIGVETRTAAATLVLEALTFQDSMMRNP